jgi:hypothetical protein
VVDTIGNWTEAQLKKYIDHILEESDYAQSRRKTFDELVVTRKLILQDEMQFTQTQPTVGSAGVASALPATPDSYAKVLDLQGNVRLVPLYKVP